MTRLPSCPSSPLLPANGFTRRSIVPGRSSRNCTRVGVPESVVFETKRTVMTRTADCSLSISGRYEIRSCSGFVPAPIAKPVIAMSITGWIPTVSACARMRNIITPAYPQAPSRRTMQGSTPKHTGFGRQRPDWLLHVSRGRWPEPHRRFWFAFCLGRGCVQGVS